MNVSEYIVDFLANKGVKHCFGYQGTMIAYFVDAVCKNNKIENHSCYHEQGAAFAACGYAKLSGELAVAYATSGPGALNLVSGIADAYYDSAPVLFLTGQLNTTEYTKISTLRQQGFQETDIVNIVKPITKYASFVSSPDRIAYELEKAVNLALEGRKGPVLLDIPMNVQRSNIYLQEMAHFCPQTIDSCCDIADVSDKCICALSHSERPLFLYGNGIGKDVQSRKQAVELAVKWKIPAVTSLLGRDIFEGNHIHNMGFIGSAYGHRCANIIACDRADLIISFGCSLCRRQTGNIKEFAKNAKIIRIDIDPEELKRKVHEDECSFLCDANAVISEMLQKIEISEEKNRFEEWLKTCQNIKSRTQAFDKLCTERKPNTFIETLSENCPDDFLIVSDVGQHQMWTAQSFMTSADQRILFSGGHGAMGFALPASIGAYYAAEKRVLCISGDGSFQMNIQELQWIVREKLPIAVLILNNHSLGLIRQQQDDLFDGNYFGAVPSRGYLAPSFCRIAQGYGIENIYVKRLDEIAKIREKLLHLKSPILIEVLIDADSKAVPKTYFGEKMTNQRPYMSQDIWTQIKD